MDCSLPPWPPRSILGRGGMPHPKSECLKLFEHCDISNINTVPGRAVLHVPVQSTRRRAEGLRFHLCFRNLRPTEKRHTPRTLWSSWDPSESLTRSRVIYHGNLWSKTGYKKWASHQGLRLRRTKEKQKLVG